MPLFPAARPGALRTRVSHRRSLPSLRSSFVCALIAGATIALTPVAPAAAQSRHPLDPLSFQEHWAILEVLNEAGRFNDSTRVALVALVEPSKEAVWAWTGDVALPRTALAVIKQQARAYEAVVDVGARRLVRWTELEGQHPNWLEEEFFSAVGAVLEHPEFVEAMARRGITDFTFIDCFAVPLGYFALPEQEGRRTATVFCADARGLRNTYPRAITGLQAMVDVNAGEVLRVIDEGIVPMTSTTAEYDAAALGPLRENPHPIVVSQPLGPGFTMTGHVIEWDAWRFHVRPDHRVGAIVSTVTFRDGERMRPVLYQGALSEIFVPYMDPSQAWYARNFLDAGEYVAGGLLKSLAPGVDCPAHAAYMPQLIAQDNGRPRVVPNALCLFERVSGDMLWRHSAETVEGRPKRDLVVRSAAVLGNYDYVFDWVFQQDGSIRVGVGATGINEVKIVREGDARVATSQDDDTESAAAPDAYGRFVAPNIVAVNHDHYFNFRLDLDVDGSTNAFVQDRLETETMPETHPRRSVWAVRSAVARREADAQLNMDMHHPSLWRVTNPARTNHVGYATSYQLLPGMSIATLLAADDYPRRRAGFIDHHLWVTPYAADELYAAGMYPTLSRPGEGLPRWTAGNRSIDNTDIVLWYTLGMHHVARAEDWPVMPVSWNWFELRPFDFFDGNPSLR